MGTHLPVDFAGGRGIRLTGLARGAGQLAKILFFIFLVIFIIILILAISAGQLIF
jgi:uncharacterized membrane protein YtjA (UPF0391 family)